MVVYILLGEYDCQGSVASQIIAVKESEQHCLDIARGIDKVRDGWDNLIIEEWGTTIGCITEYNV